MDVIVRTTLIRVTPAVHARSIVGRFLEHARSVAFRRDGAWEIWCGSFDAMPRAFERRYEIMFPVADERAKRAILQELRAQLRDDANAYELRPDGSEVACWGGRHSCQRMDARHHPPAPAGAEDLPHELPRGGPAAASLPAEPLAEPGLLASHGG